MENGFLPDTYEEFLEIAQKGGADADLMYGELGAVVQCARCPEDIFKEDTLRENLSDKYDIDVIPDEDIESMKHDYLDEHLNYTGFCYHCGNQLEKD